MSIRRVAAALSVLAIAGLATAGCGQQTDARVDSGATSAATSAAAPAATSAPATAAATASDAGAAAAYTTVNCSTGEAVTSEVAPEGTAVTDSVIVSIGPDGIPLITIAGNAQPATSLVSADLAAGSGPAVEPGQTLTVDYCGVGLGTKSMFDSSYSRQQPATFPLDGLIPGWQQGLPGMQAGGLRVLVIPGELAYGENAPSAAILANETLVFTIGLQSIG